jgi:hypothetical protein
MAIRGGNHFSIMDNINYSGFSYKWLGDTDFKKIRNAAYPFYLPLKENQNKHYMIIKDGNGCEAVEQIR